MANSKRKSNLHLPTLDLSMQSADFRKNFFRLCLAILFGFGANILSAQSTIKGRIISDGGLVLEAATIGLKGETQGTISDETGKFELKVPSDQKIVLIVSYVGFEKEEIELTLKPGETKNINITLYRASNEFREVNISDEQSRRTTFQRIDPKVISQLPTSSGNFESVLFTLPGVVSNNETSSQYSVRGGNFDENLIYVNDVLVYRPFLVRAGQQEGLSFINPDMVSSILFSAGGFEAKYGDKMSSVLDIKYKEPERFGGSITGSFLGAQLHVEDASKDYRFTQIHGFRYRTNQYLLNALDNQGDYRPNFTDYQGYFTYDINEKWEVGALLNYARNRYQFVPENRQTDFGSINEALRLTVFFAGQEITNFETFTGAFSTTHRPNKNVKLKYIFSGYQATEEESFDVEAAYRLDELERDIGSDNFGNVAFNRGVGSYLNYARNFLDARVLAAEHKGEFNKGNNQVFWGARYQNEYIDDFLNEFRVIDSVGFSIPYGGSNGDVNLYEVIKSSNQISSNRVQTYGQYSKSFTRDSVDYTFDIGGRLAYWDLNGELLFSPRASFSIKPNWNRDILFRAAWGYYYQPPFYREMRDLFGNINTNIKSQQSIHYVVAMDYNFRMFNRPFKITSEVYYKQLDNLIPYEIDNVRLRYYATNNSVGFARGIDFKLNGEWIEGVDSWISLGIMDTREDLVDDFFYHYFNQSGERIVPGFTRDNIAVDSTRFEPGFVPRPTDQRVTFGLFLQDYLPRNPTFKVHLNLLFGSGLPFGPPSYDRYKDTLRIPPYRRVDVGFSKQLIGEGAKNIQSGYFKFIKSMWVSLEVFNLLQVNNTISYLWIRDVRNREYAVPNYLTNRQVNLRLITRF